MDKFNLVADHNLSLYFTAVLFSGLETNFPSIPFHKKKIRDKKSSVHKKNRIGTWKYNLWALKKKNKVRLYKFGLY